MTQCIDSDAAVALASFADDPIDVLEHVAACEACRAQVDDTARLRAELAAVLPMREGFVQAVMASLPGTAAAVREESVAREPAAVAAPASVAWTAVHGLLGAGLGLFVALSGGTAAPGSGSPLLAMGLAAAAALTLPRMVER